jgi:Domain of unknown function (DUF4105)
MKMAFFLSFLFRWIILPLVLVIFHLWSFGALYYSPIQPESLRALIAYCFLAGVPLAVLVFRSKKWAVVLPLAGFLCVLAYEWQIQPKTNAHYPPLVERTAYAEFNGDHITLHNIRNTDYRTIDDFDVHWETREYDLKDLQTLDVFVNYWGMDAIAHVFVSFGFAAGRYLAVSIEYRPEVGESYGTFNGLFKQYEITYVWADERDIARVRTNYKKEDLYLYRTTLAPDKVRDLFVSMLERTNALHEKPEFYNTATQSCTNTIGDHIIKEHIFDLPFWKRRILTGATDRRLYEQGLLETLGRPFPELRAQSKVNDKAKVADQDPDFSNRIRAFIVQRPA